jgi:thioredoxin reductase
MKARRDSIDRLVARENVSFVWDSEVSDILGETGSPAYVCET